MEFLPEIWCFSILNQACEPLQKIVYALSLYSGPRFMNEMPCSFVFWKSSAAEFAKRKQIVPLNKYVNKINPFLKEVFVLTTNISLKKILHTDVIFLSSEMQEKT